MIKNKNGCSYLNLFSKFLLIMGKSTHGADKDKIYVGEITEKLICDFRLWRLNIKLSTSQRHFILLFVKPVGKSVMSMSILFSNAKS